MTEQLRLPRMSPQESAEYRARQGAVIALGVANIRRQENELIRRGILDACGNLIKPFVPPTGQSGLHSETDE